MGSCCESCARAALPTTCAPCAADVGALFGAARRVDDPNIHGDRRVDDPNIRNRARWLLDAGAPPAPPPETYTDLTLGIINDVLSSPFAPEFAPVVRVTGLVLELVAKEILAGPSIIADLIPEALSAALAGAGSLAEMIPMLGEIISVAVEFGGAPERTDEENEAQCRRWYLPPGGQVPKNGSARAGHGLGSGDGGSVVPADFFVSLPDTYTSDPNPKNPQQLGANPSSIGKVLRAMSEEDPGPDAVAALRKYLRQPQLGVPAETRALFRRMRTAMEISWMDGATDGGVALWPFYLELFRREKRLGHLSDEYARFLAYYSYWIKGRPADALKWSMFAITLGPQALPSNPLHCDRYDQRRILGTLAMLERWRLMMEPTYKGGQAARMERDGLKLLNEHRFVPIRPGAGAAMMKALARPQQFRRTGRPTFRTSSSGGGAVVAVGAAAAVAHLLGYL